jgi:signal transduction histidine kinase
VADSGVGIEKDKQKIIFERFRQADDGLSRRYEGAGLGLAISKNLVEMMGGRIWVESVVEKGSYFILPYP